MTSPHGDWTPASHPAGRNHLNRRLLLVIVAFVVIIVGAGVIAAIVANSGSEGDNEQLTGVLSHPQPGVVAVGATPEDTSAVHCGVQFWAKKTLTDSDVSRINMTPQVTTIDSLRAAKAPPNLDAPGRYDPVETQVYTITADATELKQEADGDFHMVLSDPGNHHTMIVEFPDAAHCVNAPPALRNQMAAARAAVIARFGRPSTTSFQKISGMVTVTGVGFFDKIHGQAGVAPSGVEIHPVLSFK